ncbi:p53 and DNA damage-regulated protein 1 [Anabrus simplex]|uniref:p53 and DNA damage-regulated protein 1 n=1 Tax=Anabrus simplex TaxID=316456 RepID=UPI0034DDAAFB
MTRAANDLGLLENPQRSLEYLSEVEELGEDILTDRQEIVALDRRRNHNREAIRALTTPSENKAWMTIGSLLVKLPTEKATEVLKKDQVQLDVEINKIRSNLKVKVNRLRDLEHQSPVPGLMLKAMSPQEISTIKVAMGVNK